MRQIRRPSECTRPLDSAIGALLWCARPLMLFAEPLRDCLVDSAKAEHRVDLVVGQRPVGRGHRAQHVAVQADLVKRDGIVEPVVKVISHGSTSVTCPESGPDRSKVTGWCGCPA